MSENTTSTQSTEEGFLQKVVKKVQALFNLTEDSKIAAFYRLVIEETRSEINKRETRLDILTKEHEAKLRDLERTMVDVKNETAEAYLRVDINRLASHKDRKDYITTFLEQTEAAENNLQLMQEEIDNAQAVYEDVKKLITAEIETLQGRISRILSEK